MTEGGRKRVKTYKVPTRGGGHREVDVEIDAKAVMPIDWFLAQPNMPPVVATDPDKVEKIINDFLHDSFRAAYLPTDAYVGRLHVDIDYDTLIQKTRERLDDEPVYADICDALIVEFEEWWRDEATRQERGEIAIGSMLIGQRQFGEVINAACDILIAMHRVRNGRQPFLSFDMVRQEIKDLPLDDREALLDPANFDVLFRGHRWARWFRMMERCHVRNLIGLGCVTGRETHWRIDAALAATNDPVTRDRLQNMRSAVEKDNNPFRYNPDDYPIGTKERRQVREARKVVLRGVAAFERCFGAKGRRDILAFLRGEPIFIRGRLFDYRAMKSYAAWDHSIEPRCAHIPYHLAVYSKDGNRLANGCVYFDGAPLVDQLLGLALHVRDEDDERTLLKQMNLGQHTEAFLTDPIMAEVNPGPLPVYTTRRRFPMRNMLSRKANRAGSLASTKRQMIEVARKAITDRLLIPPEMTAFYAVPPISSSVIARRHRNDPKAHVSMMNEAVNLSIPVNDVVRRDLRSFVPVAVPVL